MSLTTPISGKYSSVSSPVMSHSSPATLKRILYVFYNDTLNTCLLVTKIREREREMFYLTMHSTHFIYGYMASDIWLRKETRCRHIGYSYRLTARVLLYAPSYRQDNTYHGLCYTSRGALAGTRNSSMGHKNKSPDYTIQ